MSAEERVTAVECVLEVEGEVLVCDPCYFTSDGTSDPGDMGYRFDGTGKWRIWTETSDEGSWGLRVRELRAERSSCGSLGVSYVASSNLGVDAGLMAFIPIESGPVPDWSEFCDEIFSRGFDKEDRRSQPMLVQRRAISSSGFGDGTYTCYVEDGEDGRPGALRVVFIEEDEPWD